MNINEVRKDLAKQVETYIKLIKQEYGQYIPEEVLIRLENITNYEEIIKIYDYGSINAYADYNSINMPLCADKILTIASKVPGYGISKNSRPYNDNNIVINNNTFLTYIKHVFISGTNAEGYYSDLLLHETMHFCGSGGAGVIQEGINELLTRMLAQKYGLRTNSCGYPKEVKLAYDLMQAFGEEIVIQMAFIRDPIEQIKFLEKKLGSEAAEFYDSIFYEADIEFMSKYYSKIDKFSGITGIAKKVLFYNKLDYSRVHEQIKQYILSKTNKTPTNIKK